MVVLRGASYTPAEEAAATLRAVEPEEKPRNLFVAYFKINVIK